MSTQAKKYQHRPTTPNAESGGLLATGFVNRANPVLSEDIIAEPLTKWGQVNLLGDYVRFFDGTDSHLHSINAIMTNSPTTRSIIRQKATLVAGDGFLAMKGRANTLFQSLAKQNQAVTDARVLELLDDEMLEVNSEGDSLLDVVVKVATDYLTYGNAYFSMSRAEEKTFCMCLPFAKGRVRKRNADGEITHVGFSDDWSMRFMGAEKADDIAVYPNWSTGEDGIERTVVHLKDYAPGFDYYGLPEWISALMYAELEYRISKFNSSKFDNSFVPSGILNVFGAKTEAEGKALIDGIKKQFKGTGKNGGLFVQALRDESYKAHYQPLEDKSEGAFLELSRVAAQAVVSAHRWTMSLAGFATKGQLGSNEQIRREFEIAQNTVIRPIQQLILRKCVNVFVQEIADGKAALNGVYLDLSNATPVSFVGDIDINAVLTTDEKRSLAGYEPLPKSQKQDGSNNDTNTNPA